MQTSLTKPPTFAFQDANTPNDNQNGRRFSILLRHFT